MRYFTERKEPKNIGKSAITTKLEYATSIPSGVAAALPVAFLAVSFTAAERFATVSFTTDSAMLTLSMFFCSRKRAGFPEFLAGLERGYFLSNGRKTRCFPSDQLFTCFNLHHYRFNKKIVALVPFSFERGHILFSSVDLPVYSFLWVTIILP